MEFAVDGAVRVEELVGDVGKDGGPAWGDAALGNQDEQPGKKLADIRARGELGEFREQVGGEVFGVGLGRDRSGDGGDGLRVAEAKTKVSRQTGKAAALAVGIEIGAARNFGFARDCDGIGDGAGANRCAVHEFFLFLVKRGVHTPPLHA